MPELSGPLVGQPFTDSTWRAIVGDEPGIVGDVNGSSYRLLLSASSDVATLGSTSQDSTSVVAGFMHRIAAGDTQEVTIPPASGGYRTDIIAVRYDPTYTTAPGPCRLYRIPGATGAEAPMYDSGPPGVEEMPLYAVTRQPGEALSQAAVQDLRVRRGPNLTVRTVDDLPNNAPIGTVVTVNTGATYRRLLTGSTPTWVRYGPPTSIGLHGVQGTAIGGAPPGDADFKLKAGHAVNVSDVNGYVRVNFTSAFPNGLIGAYPQLVDALAHSSQRVQVGHSGSTPAHGKGYFIYRYLSSSGGHIANGTHRISWWALGW